MQEGATVDGELYFEVLEDWPLLIGRFICAFSSCEYWTYLYLQGLGSAAIRSEFANERLDRRVDKIKVLAKERGVGDALWDELVAVLGELKWLGNVRNLVSHNAPMAHLYVHEGTGDSQVIMELRAANDLKNVATKENLVKWFQRARQLEDRLAMLAGRLS